MDLMSTTSIAFTKLIDPDPSLMALGWTSTGLTGCLPPAPQYHCRTALVKVAEVTISFPSSES
ncbi:unnamed protein product [Citrullus colocynthis]|uniref:Uncharacterized protein n=1 Tax=Citrullus colocynthis TaxID=252529 RepID=A0ABP0XQV1_9ROSI